MRTKFNILHALDCRERFLRVASPYRLNLKILRQLVVQPDTTFTKIWEIKSRHPITCEDGKLYLENFSSCFTLCGMQGLPSKLYCLPPNLRKGKIEDAVVYSGPLNHLTSKLDGHKPFFLALTDNNWLHLYDNFTGQLLDNVYLGSPQKHKFKHVDWNTHGESVTVQSIRNQAPSCLPCQKPRVLVTIAVFTVFPLEFEALLEIDREIFGKDCNHVNVSEGLLIVGTGLAINGSVKLYDFQQLVNEGLMFPAKLHERCEQFDGQLVGSYPAGLPLNCKIKESPPVLFDVRCSEYTLHIGGYPWHYVTMPPRREGVFEVRALPSKQFVRNGWLDFPSKSTEPDSISFLPDDSGRIVYNAAHSVKFFKLMGNDVSQKEVKECFELSFNDQQPQLPQSEFVSLRMQRQVRRKSYALEVCEKSILSDDYENELDLYAILGFDPHDGNCWGKIKLTDNQTGQTMKVIDLGMRMDEFSDYTLTMDLETLIILVRNQMHQFSCFVYRLDAQVQEQEKDVRHSFKPKNLHKKSKRGTKGRARAR